MQGSKKLKSNKNMAIFMNTYPLYFQSFHSIIAIISDIKKKSLEYRKLKAVSDSKIDIYAKKLIDIVNRIIQSEYNLENNIQNSIQEYNEIANNLVKEIKNVRSILPIGIESIKDELYLYAEKLTEDRETILISNTEFALDILLRIISFIVANVNLTDDLLNQSLNISYEQSITEIQSEPIPNEEKECLIKFVKLNISLQIIITIVFLHMYNVNNLKNKQIDTLSILLRDWTQEVGALSMKLGIWNPSLNYEKIDLTKSVIPTEEEINEQQKLADLGFKEWLEEIKKEEKNNE